MGSKIPRRAWPLLAMLVAAVLGMRSQRAAADNGIGAWSALAKWPLIPNHAVAMPDGRVLTYGSNSDGAQTGGFIYDVWSPSLRLVAAAHWTLPNVTPTDLFFSAQIVLPQNGDVALLGGDRWSGSRTTNVGNNNSNIFSPTTDRFSRGAIFTLKRRI